MIGWVQKNVYLAVAIGILVVSLAASAKLNLSQSQRIGAMKETIGVFKTERDQARLDLNAKTQVADALRVSLDDALETIRVGKNTQALAAEAWKQDYDRLVKEAATLRRNLNAIYSSTPTCTSLAELDIAAACPAAASGMRERARRMSAP